MSAFTFGLMLGGMVGVPIACWLVERRRRKKEERDGSKDIPL